MWRPKKDGKDPLTSNNVVEVLPKLCGTWRDQKGSIYKLTCGATDTVDVSTRRPSGQVIFSKGLIKVSRWFEIDHIIWSSRRVGRQSQHNYVLVSFDNFRLKWEREGSKPFEWERLSASDADKIRAGAIFPIVNSDGIENVTKEASELLTPIQKFGEKHHGSDESTEKPCRVVAEPATLEFDSERLRTIPVTLEMAITPPTSTKPNKDKELQQLRKANAKLKQQISRSEQEACVLKDELRQHLCTPERCQLVYLPILQAAISQNLNFEAAKKQLKIQNNIFGSNKTKDEMQMKERANASNLRPGDWNCGNCRFTNFAHRNTCRRCHAPWRRIYQKPQGQTEKETEQLPHQVGGIIGSVNKTPFRTADFEMAMKKRLEWAWWRGTTGYLV